MIKQKMYELGFAFYVPTPQHREYFMLKDYDKALVRARHFGTAVMPLNKDCRLNSFARAAQ